MQQPTRRGNREPYGTHSNRKYSRRKRRAIPGKAIARMSLLCAAVALCGLGVNRLMAHFSESPVVYAEAAQSSIVENEASLTDEEYEDSDDVMPCYTDDALVVDYLDVEEEEETHDMIEELAEEDPSAAAPADNSSSTNTPADMGGSGVDNIPYWKTVNSDTVGWLKVPGTNINYAVVQGPYTNYYTSLGYDKTYSKQGVIWADSACSFNGGLSSNTVIYGHNWTNYGATPRIGSASDTHFAQLTAFQHLNFAQNHQFIWFSTEGQEMKWQIFAAFYTDIDFNYISSAGGQWIIDGAIARSEHNYDVPVSSSDQILTLSTCTRRFGSSNRQRFVVMAKLVDSSASAATVTSNPSPVRPNL